MQTGDGSHREATVSVIHRAGSVVSAVPDNLSSRQLYIGELAARNHKHPGFPT